MKTTFLLALAATLCHLVSSAFAAEVSRDEYKARVEPICKTNKQASDRYLTGVKALVKNDKLDQAARNFAKAAAALEKAEKQLAAVPQPPADALKLNKWLLGIVGQVSQMRSIATKLEAGEKGKASSLSVKLTHDATATDNLVVGFSFNYCKIDPSKYT